MAITGSAPSSAATATAAAGSTTGLAASDAASSPGDFLGMLGNLVQASAQVLVQSAAQPPVEPTAATATSPADATQAATISETLAPLLAALGADVIPTPGPTVTSSTDATADTDPSTTPEAAASTAAMLAQLLAAPQSGAQATVGNTPSKSLTSDATASPARQPATASSMVPADASAAAAPVVAPFAPVFVQAAGSVAANDAQATGDEASLDAGLNQDASAAAAPGASARPLAGGAQAAKASTLEDLLAASAMAATSRDNPTTDSSGFRSLASLLGAGTQRAEAGASLSTGGGPQQQALQTVLSQPASASTTETVAAGVMPERLRDPVGSAKWADALGARLTMMATRGEQHGSLRLSPEHLGPLEVQIRVQDDKATVWFGAQHADTRAALQDALPRLRELFAASGMQLGDAGVSREAPRQDRAPADNLGPASGETAAVEDLALPPAVASVVHAGLVDTYA